MKNCLHPVSFATLSRLRALLAVAMLLLSGCRSSGLDVHLVRSATAKPGNVAVYFRVDRSDGTPVGGLKAESFKIYEDNSLISEFESKQTILNPTVAASHYTLLLVDMSGSISKSGQAPAVVDAASEFTEKVEKFQKVGVYAFDGSTDLYPIVPFTGSGGAAKGGIKSLASFQPKDPSTNLHGAVVKALETLKSELSRAEHPLRFGTLVVFTDGTDHAGRVPRDDMMKALRESEYDIFAIGLGAEISEHDIGAIGRNGTAMAKDREAVRQAFDQIAQKIQGYSERYYLLSYCTPARAGEHDVRLEATATSESSQRHGNLTYRFKADNFGPGCDPRTLPSFDVTKGDAIALKEPSDKDKETGKPAGRPSSVGKRESAPKRPRASSGSPSPTRKPGSPPDSSPEAPAAPPPAPNDNEYNP
ncbi:MAG TPA: VWA domain-containing protein [Polyangiaceae bacterium]|nr:VWA domain-containing protein [Polyangiaceae bacterium]